MAALKKYGPHNFFKYTFCEFEHVEVFNFPKTTNYKSKSESEYYYTANGVYRKSNHWGRVATCRWKLLKNTSYKNQKIVIGFAKWTDFIPIQSSENIFFIEVDYEKSKAKITSNTKELRFKLYNYAEAQRKVKEINKLLKSDKWTQYYNYNPDLLKKELIDTYINSDKSIASIKKTFNETLN